MQTRGGGKPPLRDPEGTFFKIADRYTAIPRCLQNAHAAAASLNCSRPQGPPGTWLPP